MEYGAITDWQMNKKLYVYISIVLGPQTYLTQVNKDDAFRKNVLNNGKQN